MRYDPYVIFDAVENLRGLTQTGTYRQRSERIWEWTCGFWREDRTRDEIREQHARVRHLLKLVVPQVLHERYRTSSRARWLCALKAHLRVAAGVLGVMRQFHRVHVRNLLRLAPVALHAAVASVEDTGTGAWAAASFSSSSSTSPG